jgi:hypothetical protein
LWRVTMWAHPDMQLFNHVKQVKGPMGWYEFYLRCLLAAYPNDKVFRRALEDATGGAAGGVGCVHYWEIEGQRGPNSRGVCRKCGAVRYFTNAYTDALAEVPYGKMLNLKSNRKRR